MKFTITIYDEKVIEKFKSLKRKKGKYISDLIEKDMRMEEIEKRIDKLEGK